MSTEKETSPETVAPQLSPEQRHIEHIGTLKDRFSIAVVLLVLAFVVFMMFADAIENFQCSAWEIITFKCNRFDAKFKLWE
ncbi:MAG: Sec-independent protein secretion pathway component TatC [Gammaproteobacteria bacterium]|jgi:Sec-independent protein secretion pathway component TatC